MFTKKSLLAILLASVTLLSACGSSGGSTADTTAAANDTTAAVETEPAETTREPLNLPDEKYDGYEFKVLATSSHYISNTGSAAHHFSDFGYSEELAGEPINDAVNERNAKIEEKYGAKVVLTEAANVMTEAQKFIPAGDNSYDIILPVVNQSYTLAQSGYLVNMYDMPHIQLDKDWWDSKMLDQLSMGGRIYALTGDISMEDEEYNCAFYFNKALIDKYSLDDPYKMVFDGSWTMDVFYDMGKKVTHDVNGDGKLDHNDSFGFGNDFSGNEGFLLSTGANHARLNKDGVPEITILEERTVSAMEKINKMITDKNFIIWASDINNATGENGWTVINNMLAEDRLLYRLGNIYNCKQYRDMLSDFGMLPYPKYDETQDEYYISLSTHAMTGISVPITNPDLDRTGLLLEALAYESIIVKQAYYDVTLTGKYARDEESIRILDTIFEARCYDIGKVFGWGGFTNLIYQTAQNNTGFISTMESAMTAAQTAMEKSYNDFMEGTK